MALSFTRPRHIQATIQIGLGGYGSVRRPGGCGLLIVLVDDPTGLDDLGARGVLERRDVVQPGYERLGHGSSGAEHQLLHH